MIVFGGNTHNDTSVSHGAKCYSADVLAYDMVCDKWYVLSFLSKIFFSYFLRPPQNICTLKLYNRDKLKQTLESRFCDTCHNEFPKVLEKIKVPLNTLLPNPSTG